MADAALTPAPKLTSTQWLILVIASIGFAFDIYELLMLPLIIRPAMLELINAAPGTPPFADAVAKLFYIPALAGGIFGLLGGYLTDLLGRRRVLTWSILLYAVSAFLAGFSTSFTMLLILRCTTFIGVCVEFVAAVAWLAELFPNPAQREKVIGYTQAFSSIGGMLVAAANWVALQYGEKMQVLPGIHMPIASWGTIVNDHAAWRYTLMSGLIPAIPLIVIRPFLPESPEWAAKKAAGTLKRPSFGELFAPQYLRTTVVTTLLFACSYGAAFGAIQQITQIVPGLPEVKARAAEEIEKAKAAAAAAKPAAPASDKAAAAKPAAPASDKAAAAEPAKAAVPISEKPAAAEPSKAADSDAGKPAASEPAKAAASEPGKAAASGPNAPKEAGAPPKKDPAAMAKAITGRVNQEEATKVSSVQEIGGLIGRVLLAILVVHVASRKTLLRIFLIPGLFVMPFVFGYAATTSLDMLKVGIFFAGLFTVAQFSFWGNYLPTVYPLHLRGTGESIAANIGGRLIGTSFAAVTTYLAAQGWMFGADAPSKLAMSAAIVGAFVYLAALIISCWLPEAPAVLED